ncbi:hypothetical protein AMK33_26370 [Streptomyces sp. CB02400]|nr:hypothetical protein AMK33_26370 [Streptomyces sp. CB02400]
MGITRAMVGNSQLPFLRTAPLGSPASSRDRVLEPARTAGRRPPPTRYGPGEPPPSLRGHTHPRRLQPGRPGRPGRPGPRGPARPPRPAHRGHEPRLRPRHLLLPARVAMPGSRTAAPPSPVGRPPRRRGRAHPLRPGARRNRSDRHPGQQCRRLPLLSVAGSSTHSLECPGRRRTPSDLCTATAPDREPPRPGVRWAREAVKGLALPPTATPSG